MRLDLSAAANLLARIDILARGAQASRSCGRDRAVCEWMGQRVTGRRPTVAADDEWSVVPVALTSGHKVRLRLWRVAVIAPAW